MKVPTKYLTNQIHLPTMKNVIGTKTSIGIKRNINMSMKTFAKKKGKTL